ncbi:MAG: tRNA uridine-5-carboxymethylaminomethyl(34) synthesis GTPase MnmE [bacterium]
MNSDVIIALSTPPGSAALALLRVSGKECHNIARRLARLKEEDLPIRHVTHCRLFDGDEMLDDVVLSLWQAPSSYTGEDMAEICCHGNMLIVERIIQAWIKEGARMARPGEFTERAFLNGKIDLTQAEAVMDLIQAKSERALRAAQRIQEGALGKVIMAQRESLLQLLAHLEAYIDFPEEDIQPETGEMFLQKITSLQQNVAALIGTADEGRKLREGMRVALVGAPNAGKSTLLNALLGHERAIVSEHPGTTRDTVEESILLEGIQVRFIDTAGLRELQDDDGSHHHIEKLGMERTKKAMQNADHVLYLIDGSCPVEAETNGNAPQIICVTKCDLPSACSVKGLRISALTGEGLDALKREIVKKLNLAETLQSREIVAVNARHETLLREAAAALERARDAASAKAPPEIVSADLRQALRSIGEIVGEATNEDVLDRLFQTFCIGK